MSDDLSRITESKRRTRRELQALPIEDKLRILERLRQDLLIGLPKGRNDADAVGHKPNEDAGKDSRWLRALEAISARKKNEVIERCSAEDAEKIKGDFGVISSPASIEASLNVLFPSGIPKSVEFYDKLNDILMWLPWTEEAKRVVGRLCVAALGRLPAGEGEDLLALLPTVPNPDFFQCLEYLPNVLDRVVLSLNFAREWFPSLIRRIGNDLGGGSFWKALQSYVLRHPANCLSLLNSLFPPKSEEEIAVAAFVMGSLRTLEMEQMPRDFFSRLEASFADSSRITERSAYLRSWIQTAALGGLKEADLKHLLNRFDHGVTDDRISAFWILSRILLTPSLPSEVFEHGLQWLKENCSPSIEPLAKFNVAQFATQMPTSRNEEALTLLLSLVPVETGHKGIWQHFEHFLVNALEHDKKFFAAAFVRLIESDPKGWLKVFREPRSFEWLFSEMTAKPQEGPIYRLMFAERSILRRVGLFLFDELEYLLSGEFVRQLPEKTVALAFFDFQRTAIHGAAIGKFLLGILPSIPQASDEFREEFYTELLLQLKNYPGGCRDVLEPHSAEFPLLKQAIEHLEHYLMGLRRVHNSPVNGLEVPGFRQAARLHARRFSHEVSKSTEKYSTFANFFKSVRLLYGKQFSSFHDGKLTEPSSLQKIESSVEIPRMEYIAPEMMQLRRLFASSRIRDLSQPDLTAEE